MKIWHINLENNVRPPPPPPPPGFTDCMLQKGASKVYAVDVGYGQLDYKLRTDPRVVNMEKCNIRYLDLDKIYDPIDFISIDVSFISLRLVFPVASRLLGEKGSLVCLVKPQFEAGREFVGKKGVVRDPAVHENVIRRVTAFARELGFVAMALTFSPVKGPEGNIEYLLHLQKISQPEEGEVPFIVENVVEKAHEVL